VPQKPPSPKRIERRLLVELLVRVYWFDDAFQAGLKGNGWTEMTRAQSFVLMNLTVGVKRASQLARNIGVSHQAMSQTLAEMARRGLVTIESDANDRRARLVTVAPGRQCDQEGRGRPIARDRGPACEKDWSQSREGP